MSNIIRITDAETLPMGQRYEIIRTQFVNEVQRAYVRYLLEVLAVASGEKVDELMQGMTLAELKHSIEYSGLYVEGILVKDINRSNRNGMNLAKAQFKRKR